MASSIETAPDMYFRPACAEDLETIERLEAEEYPADEAASPAQMKRRLKDAGEFFLCCEKATAGLVGYVCGTLAPPGTKTLTEETMSTHDPDGTALCIHSVCVTRDHRRQGVATRMLEAYVRFVQHIAPQVEVMLLICKEPLVALYSKAGFQVVGPSEVVHGADPWIEMSMKLSM